MDSAQVGIPSHILKSRTSTHEPKLSPQSQVSQQLHAKPNQVSTVLLYGIPIVSLVIESQERLCLAQISNTLLKQFSYNEIHNRRVALGITCVQCTPVQLEILRRAGAMPVSSRRCGMITRREAERLCKSFLGDNAPPRLPEDFAFSVHHECAWGCRGAFLPSRYNSSRAKCIKCTLCGLFFSPNKFIFHSHRTGANDKYVQPDAANFNSWRRHMKLSGTPPDEVIHAWEDVKAMFNGGTRKRLLASSSSPMSHRQSPVTPPKQQKIQPESPTPIPSVPTPVLQTPTPRIPPFPELQLPISRSLVMDYVWQAKHSQFQFPPYAALPWLKRPLMFSAPDPPLLSLQSNDVKPLYHHSAFRPVAALRDSDSVLGSVKVSEEDSDDEVDIETTEEDAIEPARSLIDSVSPTRTWSPADKDPIVSGQASPTSPPILTIPTTLGSSTIIPKPDPSPTSPGRPASQPGVRETSPAPRQLWSVARLTQDIDRNERIPFYRQDVRHYNIRETDSPDDCSDCHRRISRNHMVPIFKGRNTTMQ